MALIEGAAAILLAVVIAYYARVKKEAEKGLSFVVLGALLLWLSEALVIPSPVAGVDLASINLLLAPIGELIALVGAVIVIVGLIQACIAQFK